MFNIFKRRQPSIDIARAMDVVGDYGEYIERHPVSVQIVDETVLPYKKSVILDAICIALRTQPGLELREALVSTALALANFQPNIGKKPLFPNGLDFSDLSVTNPEQLVARFAEGSGEKARYDALKPLIQREIFEIGERVKKANQFFNEMKSMR